jgi:hypothetical protein
VIKQGLILVLMLTTQAWAAQFNCCLTDSPQCGCFDDSGAWDPVGVWIQDVALDTLGTRESCRNEGGKPYYQMRRGYNDRETAQSFACSTAEMAETYGASLFSPDLPEAWCSEAVSYWHREAKIPYETGYRNSSWHFHWRAENTNAIQSFYQVEEASGGRGRWVDWDEINYDDFRLGENAPVPGAYVRISRWDADNNSWRGNSHSLIINEMVIHEDSDGKVARVEVSLIEGNAGNAVTAANVYPDILDLTPAGPTYLSSGRKIRGFGIDLGINGAPVYDPDRLHRVRAAFKRPIRDRILRAQDPIWEEHYAPRVDKLIEYTKRAANGPKVSASICELGLYSVPDGHKQAWFFPADLAERELNEVQVTLDLLDEHPLPILGVELDWAKHPTGKYFIQWAGSDRHFHDAKLYPMNKELYQCKNMAERAAEVIAHFSEKGVPVRYVRLSFSPDAFAHEAILNNLRFRYDWGPDPDAKINPREEVIQGDISPKPIVPKSELFKGKVDTK